MKLEPRSRIAIPPMTLFVLLAIVAISSTVHGDRGGFSLNAEHVYESRQTAIIAWNGTEEVLMLSTDIGSSTGSDVVEIMPFPANPTISKGETSSFVKVKDLVNTYFYWQATRAAKQYASYSQGSRSEQDASSPAIEITFQQSIGIHYVTVVRTEEAPQLVTWLKDFLSAEGYNFTLPATLDSLIENYTQNGLNFFVVDMLKTDSNVNTIEPLIYEFATSRLYYPLHISNLFSGNTDISLFTVTNEELKDDQILGKSLLKKAQFQIKQTTSADISSNVSKLFSSNPYLCYFTFAGELNSFNQDLLAQAQPKNPATKVVLATVSLLWGLCCSSYSYLRLFVHNSGAPNAQLPNTFSSHL